VTAARGAADPHRTEHDLPMKLVLGGSWR